uniref:RNase H type-1 domain-containing protein n=1 Tax=Hordeum vulgare subsp. vulgare TaxID=112509 RepID=A0A8I6Z006_HORVV
MAANFGAANSSKPKVRVDGWKKPKCGWQLCQDSLEGYVGVVIRDQNGAFVAAANEKLEICYDVSTAEAIFVRFGLNLARTVGCSKVEVNLDNVEMISALKEGYSSSLAIAIFDDCYFLSLDFSHILFEHCFRENNKVAHE